VIPSRALSALLLVFCGLPAVPALSSAQPAGQDSAAVFGFLRPTYTSSYDVIREATKWVQGFSFKNQWKGITIENSTNYTVNSDPSSKLKGRGGDTSTSLKFTVMNLVPMTLDMTYSRVRQDNASQSSHDNQINGGASATYNRRFGPGTNAALSVGIGVTNRKNTNTYSGNLSGSKELGLTRDMSASGTYTPPIANMTFKFNTSLNALSTTPKLLNAAPGTRDESKTNTRNSLGLNWNWSPVGGLSADASFSRSQSNLEFILSSRDTTKNNRTELAKDLNTLFSTSLNFKPDGNRTDLRAEIRASQKNNQRRIEKERQSEGHTLVIDTRLRHTLFGNVIVLHAENNNSLNKQPTVGADTTLTRTVDLSLERQWNQDLTTKVIGELRLRTQKHEQNDDDEVDETAGKQDFDQLKRRVEGTVFYQVFRKLSTNLSGRWVAEDGVFVHSSQSRNSRDEETYGANAGLTYSLSSRTQVIQKYDFTARFTAYDFDSTQSAIQRSRSVNTTVRTDLTKRVAVSLGHTYSLEETGGYRRLQDGTRIFYRSNMRYRQEIRTSLTYRPVDWITLTTEERLYRTDDKRVAARRTDTSGQLFFTQRASFKHSIPGGGNISCDMTVDIQKNVRPSVSRPEKFFTAKVSLDKSF
jgi:hypothetical protein